MNRLRRDFVLRLVGLAVFGATIAGAAILWAERVELQALLSRLHHHTTLLAIIAGVASLAIVSNRRSAYTTRAPRSWLAALPMTRRGRRIEALLLQLGVTIALAVLLSCLTLLIGIILALAGLSLKDCLAVAGALLSGIGVGAVIGLIVPAAKPETPYPGSRYVPHQPPAGPHPVPSLSGLAIWPVRRMFAMLRPRMLSRTLLPVLIMMPLGTSAAAAMGWIGMIGASIALFFLAGSIAHVARAARRWLQPLPLDGRRLSLSVAGRSLVLMFVLGAVAAWLGWVAQL